MRADNKTNRHFSTTLNEQNDGYTPTQPMGKSLSLYIAEEQQILREAYQSFFLPHPIIEVSGSSGDT
ncbi:MAG: hypothetical protein QGI09_11420, partial [Dehalococcoidia bacterium]|nr:hypothetical protein [Dehalococcoidia bacterium]